MRACALGVGFGPFPISQTHTRISFALATCAVSRVILLELLRPGSGVSILLRCGRRRALAFVRVVVSALWRDDA